MKNLINHVYIIVPVFPEDDSMMDRVQKFNQWSAVHAADIANRYKATLMPLLLAPGITLALKGGATIRYSTPGGRSPKVPKGLAVRLSLIAILDLIDNTPEIGVRNRNRCFIVQIDGSGAFAFDNIAKVLDKLVFEGRQVVLGMRTGDRWFMSHAERKCVELFENSFLELWHTENRGVPIRPDLIDAQAGCWGLNAGALRALGLTASNYEIEFDFIASVVQSGCQFDFTEPLIEGVRIGSSGHTSADGQINFSLSIEKVPFIAHKLGLTRDQILEKLDAYVQQHTNDRERELPPIYVKQLRKVLSRRSGKVL